MHLWIALGRLGLGGVGRNTQNPEVDLDGLKDLLPPGLASPADGGNSES